MNDNELIGNAHVSKYATLFCTSAQFSRIVGNLQIALHKCMSKHLWKRMFCHACIGTLVLFTVAMSRAQTLLFGASMVLIRQFSSLLKRHNKINSAILSEDFVGRVQNNSVDKRHWHNKLMATGPVHDFWVFIRFSFKSFHLPLLKFLTG